MAVCGSTVCRTMLSGTVKSSQVQQKERLDAALLPRTPSHAAKFKGSAIFRAVEVLASLGSNWEFPAFELVTSTSFIY